MRSSKKRWRHLLTIWRGVSSRVAMTSLPSPSAASRTIFARITSRYGDVYLRARASNAARPSALSARVAACFQRALEVARHQAAKSLELRVAMSLCRLWTQQDGEAAARAVLAQTYSRFTEGLATVDLQEAARLLIERPAMRREPGDRRAELNGSAKRSTIAQLHQDERR